MLPALSRSFRHLDRPAPVDIQWTRRPGALGECLIEDASGGVHRLTLVFADLEGSGVRGPLVAARRLEGVEEVPVLHSVTLPLEMLGYPAILQPVPTGRPADQGGDADRALTAIGRLLDALSREPQPDRGVAATPFAFRPVADDWAGEWRWLCERWAEIARRGGTAWQPLVDRMRMEASLAPIDLDGAPVLVPPGLEPSALWLDEGGELRCVDGWVGAWSGDRWSAWAPLLHLPASALATVRAAFFDPPELAKEAPRLRGYAAGFILRLLARAAVAVRPRDRVDIICRALFAADALATLPSRLAAADRGEESPPLAAPRRAAVLSVMDRLIRDPQVVNRERWLAIAGAVLVAHHQVGSPDKGRWDQVADHAIGLLEPGLDAAPLINTAEPLGTDGDDGLVVRWIAQELRQAAGEQAPEGFDQAIAQLSRIAARRADRQERLAEAVLALAAAARLKDPVPEARQARLARAAQEAWEELDFGQAVPQVPVEAVLRRCADPEAHTEARRPIALLLLALARGGTLPLPAPVQALLDALGVELKIA